MSDEASVLITLEGVKALFNWKYATDLAGLSSGTVTFTPEICAAIMDGCNRLNRRFISKKLSTITRVMVRRRFRLNGESIIFGASGRLLNGQHRLQACIDSGEDFQSIVVLGVSDEEDAYDTIDDVAVRNFKQRLARNNVKGYSTVASAVRSLGLFLETGRPTQGPRMPIIPIADLQRILDDWPMLIKGVELVSGAWRSGRRLWKSPGATVAMYVIFDQVDARARRFFDIATDSAESNGKPAESAAMHLRRRLFDNATNPATQKMPATYLAAITFKAWALFLQGKEPTKHALTYKATEPFPEAAGWSYKDDKPSLPAKERRRAAR